MSAFSADLNGVRVLRVRLVTCWRGPWFADCDLDPDSAPVTAADVPSGAVTLTISPPDGTPIVLKGTIAPTMSGRFVSSVPVRVLAGGGGWSKTVPRQQFHSDGGVSSLSVERATSAACGETVVDTAPLSLGTDWTRIAGRASRIFGNRDWYVDPSGVTQVSSRPSATPDASVELLTWEPTHQHGIISADALVLPGTQIADARFDGPITVRDVSQTFGPEGSRAEVWCGATRGGQLLGTLSNMVRELGALETLKEYRYRIVTQAGDGRLTLQAVPNADGTDSGAPDLSPASVWPGMSGLSALYKLSSDVLVTLVNGDPGFPIVTGFDGSLPQEVTLDATGTVHVGPSALMVKLAEGAPDFADAPVARVGDPISVILPPLCELAGDIGGVPIPPASLFLSVAYPLPGTIMGGASEVVA
jgi:hypothetical protein